MYVYIYIYAEREREREREREIDRPRRVSIRTCSSGLANTYKTNTDKTHVYLGDGEIKVMTLNGTHVCPP